MVEYKKDLDDIFQSLSDPTRRDIVKRLAHNELAVGAVAKPYARKMSLAAVSKHLQVLERSGIIVKRRVGKQQIVALSPPALRDASNYLRQYAKLWEDRLDRLEKFLAKNK